MKAIILIAVALIAAFTPLPAHPQAIKARVVYSTDSVPVEYATVKLMRSDSVLIGSAVTDGHGRFLLDLPSGPHTYIIVSAVGCVNKEVSLPCDSIICLDSSNELSEVVVRGSKKFVRTTSRGLTVAMSGNPIADLGSAAEALRQLPMIDASGSGLSVLGHGTPLIYINQRLIRNTGELSSLAATDITEVEIITNPSARYGAEVTSVIIIHTRKPDSGFHSVISSNVAVSEEWSGSGNVTLNYHTEKGLTVFGDFSYGFSGFRQSRYYGERYYLKETPDIEHLTETYAKARSRSQSLLADAGLNYDFGANSSGIRYTFSRTPKSLYTGSATSTIAAVSAPDEINSMSNLARKSSMHHINAFGNFALFHGIKLRVDADFVDSSNKSASGVDEEQIASSFSNSNDSHGRLLAGKLTLSKKIRKIELEAGTDFSYTRNIQDYSASSSGDISFLKPETDNVKQHLHAGFLSFDWTPHERWNLYGGIRLESTSTGFTQNGILRKDLSRTYADWLPNIGMSFTSAARLSIYYRASVSRPGYQTLDNTYIYVTPTLWESGNPTLQPTLLHRIGLNLSYKKFMLQSSFAIVRRNITYCYTHDSSDGINIVRPVNLPRYNTFQLVAMQQLDFSFWHPTLQGVFYVQNLRFGAPARKYDRPLYTLSLNNRFDIPGGIYAYLNIFRLGTGNQDLTYSNGTWQAAVTLNKTVRGWTFTLSANDIFNTWRQRFDTRTNTINYSSDINGASRSLSLSVRYTLNSAKGSYKGKTSRQDEIDRL